MRAPVMRRARAAAPALLAVTIMACGDGAPSSGRIPAHGPATAAGLAERQDPLVVSHAGSLAIPLRAALDSFTAQTGETVVTLSAGSLEAARRITELHDVPDVIALADDDVFSSLLMPAHVSGYFIFARNRIVIAVAPRRADEKTDSTNWYRAMSAPRVQVGRSDPDLDPAGYRALLVLQLAAIEYRDPSIERTVLAHSGPENVRPKSSDLVALLEAGVLDYAFVYESSARSAGLRWIALPPSINLGDETRAASYARAAVRVVGRTRGDTITIRGAPIRYALAVPKAAPHGDAAMQLAAFLLSPAGLTSMRRAGLDVVKPTYVGSGRPRWFAASLLETAAAHE